MLNTDTIVSSSEPVSCKVEMNGVLLPLLVDTGSAVTILTKETFEKHFLLDALSTPNEHQTFSSFTKHTIKITGCFKCTVKFGKYLIVTNVYVVDLGTDIMGRDLIQALNINIDSGTLSCNKLDTDKVEQKKVKSQIVHEYEQLFTNFEEMPSVKGFIHKVKVDSKVHPVSQKLRRLPFEAREKVSAELANLEKQGVIEQVDSSEWVSPIVVAWKKARCCTNLCRFTASQQGNNT